MAQLERARRSLSGSSNAHCSPTFEMLQKADETDWAILPRHEEGQSPGHSNKKSVFSIVKEKAKKLKRSLSGRKNAPETEFDEGSTKSALTYGGHADDCGDDVREDGVDDPEYLGAPMYESEAAPEKIKETARQHPRAVPVVSQNHRMPNRAKPTETIKGSAMSNPTQETTSKLPELPISTSEPQQTSLGTSDGTGRNPGYKNSGNLNQCPSCSSPQRMTNNSNVLKVKDAVTSFFWQDGIGSKSAQRSNSLPASRAKSHLTQSANSNEVLEQENHGKILQTN